MAWDGSTRKATLPPHWSRLRRLVLARDGGRCRWVEDGVVCNAPANQVDHVGDPHNHDPANLRALCKWHHDRRSGRQGAAARRTPPLNRPRERHPGLLDDTA